MLIGNNYIYTIYLDLICLHFLVIDTLQRIELLVYVIYWIKKMCSLSFWFDEYDYAIEIHYLKLSINQCMIV